MANAQFPDTSLDARAASPEELLRLNSGRLAVENLNHRPRDCVFGKDACLARTGNGPANRSSLNNIALAVIFANRRNPAAAAAGPPQGHRRSDPALRRHCIRDRRKDARHQERNNRTRNGAGVGTATEFGQNLPIWPPFVSPRRISHSVGKS